ncbi:ankyrin repeat-containing protein [Planoprotostelium fungivorum]|uniref:Ankyrin repeat-containing protein n=1 Tax=Planoprotostelium fungivorum TaxID=1890364 RepID=A0A2P6NN24_9EUKA|nr:ankyrin repeat-containing protein [Planoprotostelium fungivorum]
MSFARGSLVSESKQESDHFELTPVQKEISDAVTDKSIERLNAVLQKHPEYIDSFLSKDHSTAIHRAARLNHTDVLKFLLSKGADSYLRTSLGDTAIHVSCLNGSAECTQALIEWNESLCGVQNNNGCYPIHFAAFVGDVQSLALLLSVPGANVDPTDAHGETPLSVAAHNGQDNAVQFLIDKGASLFTTEKRFGNNILQQAAHSGSTKCVSVVLEAMGNQLSVSSVSSPVTVREKEGEPLQLWKMESTGSSGTSQKSPLEAANNVGHTALFVAIYSDRPDCARLLLENGAEINVRDNKGNTPLHAAATVSLSCTKVLINHRDQMEEQLLDAVNERGQTALIVSLKKQHVDIAIALLEAGAKLFLEDKRDAFVPMDDPRLRSLTSTHNIQMNLLEKVLKERQKSATAVMTEEQKRIYQSGVELFNQKPKKGIEYLVQVNLLKNTPQDIARFLFTCQTIDKKQVGDFIGDEVNSSILEAFVNTMNFSHLEFDIALRRFLYRFRLPGEAQKIDRIMEKFAQQYYKNNEAAGVFNNSDAVYVLAFATIMLNTDLHSSSIKKKMTRQEFLSTTKTINNGGPLPKRWLLNLYEKILNDEIKMDGAMYATAEKKGWLTKQAGGQIKTWKRRWFVLDHNILYYFKTPQGEPAGIIPLENIRVVRADAKKKYCLQLTDSTGQEIKSCKINEDGSVVRGHHAVYYIAAQSEEDLTSWMNAITNSVYHSPMLEFIKSKQRDRTSTTRAKSHTMKR